LYLTHPEIGHLRSLSLPNPGQAKPSQAKPSNFTEEKTSLYAAELRIADFPFFLIWIRRRNSEKWR